MPIPNFDLSAFLKGHQQQPAKMIVNKTTTFQEEDPGFQKFLLGLMAAAGILIYLIFRR